MIDTQKLCILQTRIDIFWVKICGISLNVTFFFRQLNGFADELRCMMVPFGNNIHDYTTLEGSQDLGVVWSAFYTVFFSKNNKFIFNKKLNISTVFSLQTTTIKKQTRFKLLQFYSFTCLEQISFVKAIETKDVFCRTNYFVIYVYSLCSSPWTESDFFHKRT